MNVIVANQQQNELANLDIDIIKSLTGSYNSSEIVEMFKSFFYSKMILDVTAINNYDQIEAMKNINNLYINYQQFLTTKNKNKNNLNAMNKKNYKKMMDENKKNELDDIPKNQRIMSKEEVKDLGITYIYKFVYFFSVIVFGVSYIILLYLWMNYFSQKSNLYTLIQKNISLEMSIYRAINVYDLMIFHNYTIDEISDKIILNNSSKEQNLYS
jgi:hypothetical protein